MGLGKAFTRPAPLDADGLRNAGSTLEALISATGGEVGGISGIHGLRTYRGGMSIPGAWRAAMLISDLLGSVPWSAYTKHGRDHLERVDPTPPLLEQPAPPDTRMTTFASWALDLVWDGNAVGLIAARNRGGWPTAVLPVPASWVGVRRVGERDHWLPVGSVEYSVGGRSYASADVVHIKGPCAPGALRGFGVLEAHLADTLSLAAEQRKQAHSISAHGVPTGFLRITNPDATFEDLNDAKAGWLAAQSNRTIAAVNATTEFEPLAWNPEQLQMVEARRFTLTELALIFGLPTSFLAAPSGDSMTYSNIEQESINLLRYSLAGHLARFEQTLSLAFPRGTVVKANLDSILRADTLTRYQAHQVGISAGFLLRSEARDIEDLPPVPGIDDPPEPPRPAPPVGDEPAEDQSTDEEGAP